MNTTKIFLSVFMSAWLIFAAETLSPVLGQSPALKSGTPSAIKNSSLSATPEDNIIDKLKQVMILKEKIATKVAELRNKDRTGVMGTVKSLESGTITLDTESGNKSIIYADDTILYVISQSSVKETPLKNLKVGDTISAIGYYPEEEGPLTASYIYRQTAKSERIVGKIADIDKDNYLLIVKSKNDEIKIDIEKNTKTYVYERGKALNKAGFSKLVVGDTIHAFVTPNSDEENRYSAVRLYALKLNSSVTPKADKPASASATPKSSPASQSTPT